MYEASFTKTQQTKRTTSSISAMKNLYGRAANKRGKNGESCRDCLWLTALHSITYKFREVASIHPRLLDALIYNLRARRGVNTRFFGKRPNQHRIHQLHNNKIFQKNATILYVLKRAKA